MSNIKKIFLTAFYSGYSPVAPGTCGTIVAALLYVLSYKLFGSTNYSFNIAIMIFVLVLMYPSVKLSTESERIFGKKDPEQVVIDEVLGYLVTVMFFPFSWYVVIFGFVLFRIFDILKPYPIGGLQNLAGGLGIIIDEIVAGLYAAVSLFIILQLMKYFNFQII